MHDLATNAITALVSALAGILIGWAGGALTMVGRVDAIEASVARLESTLHAFVLSQGPRPPAELPKAEPAPSSRHKPRP